MPARYETKYKKLIQRIQDARENHITLFVVESPQELGETYDELVESLNRIAAADLNLAILPPTARKGH
jgi:hypothetical protein